MRPINNPWWEQVTALVSLSVSGAITGFAFVPKAPADLRSPSSMPIHLLAMEKSAQAAPADDGRLRTAILNVANYFLRMAATKTPAQIEAIIWHHDSIDGVDHGESCAAFASLTLELASQAVGQQSWVTGGTSYPWPLHKWADVRVDPNPGSLGIVSVLQDAQAHHRWHPLGDGYQPKPGDWVLFDGHVEVVTKYDGASLETIGGDSLPNFSVNAHTYTTPLAAQGVVGFVNNGQVPSMTSNIPGSGGAVSGSHGGHASHGQRGHVAAGQAGRPGPGQHGRGGTDRAGRPAEGHPPGNPADGRAKIPGAPTGPAARRKLARSHGNAAIPGLPVPTARADHRHHPQPRPEQARSTRLARQPEGGGSGQPSAGLTAAPGAQGAKDGAAKIPGLPTPAPNPTGPGSHAGTPGTPTTGPAGGPVAPSGAAAPSPAPYGRHLPTALMAPINDTHAEQAFINEVARGAMAAQRRYGVPASVTIAQAIDESGWGLSSLATSDHNLFGIKGAGPAGSDLQPTQEYQNGQLVTLTSPFRIYYNIAQSINDHGQLLATSPYYRNAMANRHDPNAFAAALTGVYATDPQYGTKLIGIMQRYDLYRYNNAPAGQPARGAAPHGAPTGTTPRRPAPHSTPHSTPHATPTTPTPRASTPGGAPPTATPTPTPHTTQPTPGAPTPRPWPHTTRPVPAPHTTTPAPAPHSTRPVPAPRSTTPARAPRSTTPAPAPHTTAPAPAPHTPVATPGAGAPGRTPRPTAPRPQSSVANPGAPTQPGRAAIPGLPDTGGVYSGGSPASAPTGAAAGPQTGAVSPSRPGTGIGPGKAASRGTASGQGIAPGQGTAAGPRTSAAPRSAVGPRTSPGPGTAAGPRTSAGPGTAAGPRTAPAAGPHSAPGTHPGGAARSPAAARTGSARTGAAASGSAGPARPAASSGSPGNPPTAAGPAGPSRPAAATGSAGPSRPSTAPGPAGGSRTAGSPGSAGSSRTGAGSQAAPGQRAPRPSPAPAVPSPRAEPSPAGRPEGYTDAVLTSAMTAGLSFASSPLDRQKHQIASRRTHPGGRRYHHRIPPSVWTALIATARSPLQRGEPLYQDVAEQTGIRWELLAACDWMQCKARPGYSPVRGEKLGTVNPDGTIYHTKSEALAQCAEDLVNLAGSVYGIYLPAAADLSIRDLACVFAAFRWGGLLKLHHTSAMEFPYSVAGLTVQHTNMRWPKIDDPNSPDKPGGRFRMPFGAVPIVLSLNYPATV